MAHTWIPVRNPTMPSLVRNLRIWPFQPTIHCSPRGSVGSSDPVIQPARPAEAEEYDAAHG
jgi:hypothetical protein